MTNHFIRCAGLLLPFAFVGCAKSSRPPVQQDGPRSERVSQLAQNAPATQPGHTDLNVGGAATSDILAQKTASYAAELERLLAQRAAEGAAARAAAAEKNRDTALTAAAEENAGDANAAAPTAAPPTTRPTATKSQVAQSQVAWIDDPKSPSASGQPSGDPAAPAAAQQKPTIHQLLDTAPATANQATAIPAAGARAANVQPVIDAKPGAAAPTAPSQNKQSLPAPISSDELARKLAERIQQDPLDVTAHLDYQLLKLINDQSVPELNAIAPLPQEDREIVSALLDGLSNFRSTLRSGGNALLPQKVEPIVAMGERVRNHNTLTIPTLALCRDVDQFGIYEPFVSTRFPFGEKHQMVIYCEVANFVSTLNNKNLWETNLKYEVMVYTDADASLQVWRQKPVPVIDQCHSRRRDFFIAKLLELPADLPVGGYLMKVSLVDETANRIAEATVPLAVVAK